MYIAENKSPDKNGRKIYHSTLLRESYCKPEEIAAIRLALKYKNDLSELVSLKESVKLQEGLSIGAVWTVYQIAKRKGIEKALGRDFAGKLAMWQVIARVIDQGSRLSAVRHMQPVTL
ncbi:MAG: hypothetical protein JRI26_13395 [Deltaproteobacteria bacterium]|nr:hypothetical protein [Deltaproteobacteria bacterium]